MKSEFTKQEISLLQDSVMTTQQITSNSNFISGIRKEEMTSRYRAVYIKLCNLIPLEDHIPGDIKCT